MAGRNNRSERGEGAPAALELLAGVVLVGLAAWQLGSPDAVIASMAGGSVIGTVVMMVVLLVGVALFYLGVERIRDGRRSARGEDEDRI